MSIRQFIEVQHPNGELEPIDGGAVTGYRSIVYNGVPSLLLRIVGGQWAISYADTPEAMKERLRAASGGVPFHVHPFPTHLKRPGPLEDPPANDPVHEKIAKANDGAVIVKAIETKAGKPKAA